MSAPRIKVLKPPAAYLPCWYCTKCDDDGRDDDKWFGAGYTLAADAGRAHLSAHHTAQMPPVLTTSRSEVAGRLERRTDTSTGLSGVRTDYARTESTTRSNT